MSSVGKDNVSPLGKRSGSPLEFEAMKRGRSINEHRRSLDSVSSISSSSLDRSPTRTYGQKKRRSFTEDNDVILIRSKSRSISPSDQVHL